MNKQMTLPRAIAILTAGTLSLALTAQLGSAQARGPMPQPPSFSELDVNGDGAITRSDIEAAAQARFADADTDGNGALSEAELKAQAMARADDRAAAQSTRMLNRLDADGDGALSIDELHDAGGRRGGDRAGRMLKRADTDGDGAVSEAEYDTALAKMADRGDRQHSRKGKGDNDRRGG